MASQPTREPARILGVASAALLLAAAAAVPAFADDEGHSGNPHGTTSHSNNGNHYGQSKNHSDNADSDQAGSNGQGGQHANKGQGSEHAKNKSSSASTNASEDTGDDPAGNNGTVKIHDDYGDLAHHNVPHVDCDFAVAFWGFDLDQKLDVSFAGQAPTGKDTPLTVTGAPTIITSPDAAGGGQDYDGELQFRADQLNLASLGDPHPKQGYHIKLTVNTYEPGGHKYKVFWLQPCTTQSAVAPTAQGTVVGATATETPDETTSSGESTGGALAPAATSANGIPTTVLGRTITRGGNSSQAAAPAAASLPFTGAEITRLAAAAALALSGGAALTVAGRRRRTARRVSAS